MHLLWYEAYIFSLVQLMYIAILLTPDASMA